METTQPLFDLDNWKRNYDAQKEREDKIVATISSSILAVKNSESVFDWGVYEGIGKTLGSHQPDKYGFSFAEQVYNGFVKSIYPVLLAHVESIWKNQLDKQAAYGDADTFIEKVKNSKSVRAFTVKDVATCADENKFIVIQDLERKEIHVRVIWQYGDYPRSKYPQKPTLRFWKDRGFVCDYVEQYHMTNKGGVYGDERDMGFVYSHSYGEFGVRANESNIFFYAIQRRFLFTLFCVVCELEDRLNDI